MDFTELEFVVFSGAIFCITTRLGDLITQQRWGSPSRGKFLFAISLNARE